MRVLVHIHTLNDEAVIEQTLEGLRRQTRPPDGIIIVDNGSTDTTLNRTFPNGVTVVRNSMNLGTSGAIIIGFAHALEHGFDWTWVFDADSVPEPDALENLLAFFEHLSPSERERVCFLACRLMNAEGEVRHRPMMLTDSTIKYMPVEEEAAATKSRLASSGLARLFQMSAVAKIGLPSEDYVLDLAEFEYGYRARQLGYKSYLVHNGITHQDVGRPPGVVVTRVWNIGRLKLKFLELSPLRTYYYSRNLLYFFGFVPMQRHHPALAGSCPEHSSCLVLPGGLCAPAGQPPAAADCLHARPLGRLDRAHGAPVLSAVTTETGLRPQLCSARLGSRLLGA